ncbi:MAG: xanthine dehydrogenase family protein molybdopterin-binding subunit [Blautia sp.]|nr:xanthine dehydrogenase family protein molybdopterin-binding subunit [Blautia sp.]
MADTDETEDSGSTAASRTTYICGNAIVKAAKEILMTGSDSARAQCDFPEIPGENGVHSMFGYIVQGVKIKINPVTGAVDVLKAHNVTEAGHVLHPEMMAGQLFGGMAMSTGYTLSEQIRYQKGKAMEDSFASYVMPTSMDAPHMTNDNVDCYEESGPYGAKGVAEAATVALAPAVAAAVRRVCPKLLIRTIPIDREQILDAMMENEGGTGNVFYSASCGYCF